MICLQEQNATHAGARYAVPLPGKQPERGDTVEAHGATGRRVALSRRKSPRASGLLTRQCGFTLIELVITVTVLSILTLGVVPLMKLSVKRQKEEQLRAALRQMRTAIDEFHRDTVGIDCTGTLGSSQQQQQQQQQQQVFVDPRSKVKISDCTIFGVDNPDRYPPDIGTLVTGVNVIPRAGLGGGRGDLGVDATKVGGELSTKKKIYLRAIPIDPMTNLAEWEFCSSYDSCSSGSSGNENVFDVRSKSQDTALNGEKYSDW